MMPWEFVKSVLGDELVLSILKLRYIQLADLEAVGFIDIVPKNSTSGSFTYPLFVATILSDGLNLPSFWLHRLSSSLSSSGALNVSWVMTSVLTIPADFGGYSSKFRPGSEGTMVRVLLRWSITALLSSAWSIRWVGAYG